MANVITLDHYSRPAAELGFIARFRKAYADFRAYIATFEELNALSDRELADLGSVPRERAGRRPAGGLRQVTGNRLRPRALTDNVLIS